jgi:hypothetical protein
MNDSHQRNSVQFCGDGYYSELTPRQIESALIEVRRVCSILILGRSSVVLQLRYTHSRLQEIYNDKSQGAHSSDILAIRSIIHRHKVTPSRALRRLPTCSEFYLELCRFTDRGDSRGGRCLTSSDARRTCRGSRGCLGTLIGGPLLRRGLAL